MAEKSLIAELLKTPTQLREEREASLARQGLEQAQSFSYGNPLQGVGGLFANFGAQQAAMTGRDIDRVNTALRSAAGSLTGQDFRRPEEQQASANQAIMRTAMGGNLEQMKDLRERLMNTPNVDPRAIAALTSRINSEEDRKILRDNAEKGRGLGAADLKAIRAATQAGRKAEMESNKALKLAEEYATAMPTGGIVGSTYDEFKKFVGGTDEVSLMRTRFNSLIMSGVLDALPPGPATDKDIANAKEGFPDANFSAESIASFLMGMHKAQRIEAGYQRFYAQYLYDNNGSSAGVEQAWKEHFADNVEMYWTDTATEEEETPTPEGTPEGTPEPTVSHTFDSNNLPPSVNDPNDSYYNEFPETPPLTVGPGLTTSPSSAVNATGSTRGVSRGTMTVPRAPTFIPQPTMPMDRPRTRGGLRQRNR
jgi:hypothetical protein